MMDITIINCLAYRDMSLMIIVSCNDISDITVINQVPSDKTFYPGDMSDMIYSTHFVTDGSRSRRADPGSSMSD